MITGRFDPDHPRNERVLQVLGAVGVELVREGREFDAVWVGYPGLAGLGAARARAGRRPLILNALDALRPELGVIRRQALRFVDLVVTETEASAAALAARTGRARDRFASCFLGTTERVFHPPWTPADPFTCLATDASSWSTVLEAAVLAPEVQFRLVGGRSPPAEATNVEYLARIEPDLLGHEIRRAGCVVGRLESDGHAIPQSAFDALACGSPLITAATPAARELVGDGESALLVPPRDAAALAGAVQRLNTEFELGRRLSRGGLAAYRAHASEQALGERWRALIEGQLAHRGTASLRR